MKFNNVLLLAILCVSLVGVFAPKKKLLEELASKFELEKKEAFEDVKQYKGEKSQKKYKVNHHKTMLREDLNFILSELDAELEAAIGYPLAKKLLARRALGR